MEKEKKFFAEHDHYAILKIDAGATVLEVQEAFENLSKEIDLNHVFKEHRIRSAEKLLLLTQAYEILSDPIQRSQYDIRTFGRRNLPTSLQIETLFNEGIKAFRQKKNDLALRYFKEIVNLFPHRSLYRVHLAIIYADKRWMAFAEAELQTALRLDQQDSFAQDTIARLLFKLPDRKVVVLGSHLRRQAATLAASILIGATLWISGLPQKATNTAWAKVAHAQEQFKPSQHLQKKKTESALPKDIQEEIAEGNPPKTETSQSFNLKQFEPDYVPDTTYHDYTTQVAEQKTFYPEQEIVVVTYQDGSVLTYKPRDLQGWKVDAKTNQAVMITKDNELIPSPAQLPLTLPTGEKVEFEKHGISPELFPEYLSFSDLSQQPTQSKPVTAPEGHPPVMGGGIKTF